VLGAGMGGLVQGFWAPGAGCRMQGPGSRLQSARFRHEGALAGFGYRMQNSGFRVSGLFGYKVQGLRFSVWDQGLWVKGSGRRIKDKGFKV